MSIASNIEHGYSLGWSFTPLNGKRPTLKDWPRLPREPLEQALEWAAKGNVGLRTGQTSGVVVLDCDPGADLSGMDVPATVTAVTGRPGGLHYYFRCNRPVKNAVGLLPHVDLRGDGGQVVFPGSIHPDTKTKYRWAEGHSPEEIELAELPESILRLVEEPEKAVASPERPTAPAEHLEQSTSSVEHPTTPKTIDPSMRRRAVNLLALLVSDMQSAKIGTRNGVLNRVGYKAGMMIGAGWLDWPTAWESLYSAAKSRGLKDDEIQATLNSGMKDGTTKPAEPAVIFKERHEESKAAPPDYVLIPGGHVTDKGYVEQANGHFAVQVLQAIPADAIYRRDYIPGEIVGQDGKRRWLELTNDRMRIVAGEHVKLASWRKVKATATTQAQDDEGNSYARVYVAGSRDHAGLLLAHASVASSVRSLDLLVPYPIFLPDWSLARPGWNDCGVYYDEPEELAGLTPIRDPEVITNLLRDLVCDFPFRDAASRDNFFGLLLTPIVAMAIDGNRPLHLVVASLERSGKSKLVNEVFGGILTGRDTPSMQLTEREEERDKRILSLLLVSDTIVHLDNLPGFLDSPALASLLTSQRFSGRVLGASRTISLPNHLTIVATGNNVQATGELIKRSIPIVLEPADATPERRRDFSHSDLRSHVREARRSVLACLVGMVLNWLDAGRPKHGHRLGGFESWSEAVGGVLNVNCCNKWRTNEDAWRLASDPRTEELCQFVESWWHKHRDSEVSIAELLTLAEETETFGWIVSKRELSSKLSLFGRAMGKLADTPVGQWRIRRRTSRKPLFRLTEITQV